MRIVRNPLTGVPVVIAPGRASRPGASGQTTRSGDARVCPLCEGNEAMTPPETLALGRPDDAPPDSPGWQVRVVPNKFPAFDGQEVIIHGPRHTTRFADVPAEVLELVGTAWRLRADAAAEAGAAWVLLCVNEGPGAGASLDHSHSQLVPFAEVPPVLAQELEALTGDCRLCAALAGEHENIVSDEHGLVTFCPTWGRMPYETWIVPQAHEARTNSPEVMTASLRAAVEKLQTVLGPELAWNAVVHESPRAVTGFHWHIEILPRLTVPASVELGTGVWVNTVDPAVAAAELRR